MAFVEKCPWYDHLGFPCRPSNATPQQIYCAFCVILDPSNFQLSTIAILQQQSQSFYGAVQQLIYEAAIFFDIVRTIEELYSVQDVRVISGAIGYPNPTVASNNDIGMSFELR